MKKFCLNCSQCLNSLAWLPLLLFRLMLALGFFSAGVLKFSQYESVVKWFISAGIPLPHLAVLVAGSAEIIGAILLFLGLFTRLITLPLLFLLAVAIFTFHWKFGFHAGDNGFEVPLYYALMLFCLLIMGPGKISVDGWIKERFLRE